MDNRLYIGKRVDNLEWVEGYYVNAPIRKHDSPDLAVSDIIKKHWIITDSGNVYQVIAETVGQFTGKVVEGHKLYVGDIVEWTEDREDICGFADTVYGRSVVVYDNNFCCYSFETDGVIQPFSDWDWHNVKKIGNIYNDKQYEVYKYETM